MNTDIIVYLIIGFLYLCLILMLAYLVSCIIETNNKVNEIYEIIKNGNTE